jgi:hypothetical protein
MTVWKYKLRLSDFWRTWEDQDWSFERFRDETVRRIKASRFWDEDDMDLGEIVNELAETDDISYFDDVWAGFYDWADVNRVWVETY